MDNKIKIEKSGMIWDDYKPEQVGFSEASSPTWMTMDILRSVYEHVMEDLNTYYQDCLIFDEWGDLEDIRTPVMPTSVITLLKHMYQITKERDRHKVAIIVTGTAVSPYHIRDKFRELADETDMEITLEGFEILKH